MLRAINTAHFLQDIQERKCAEVFVGKKNSFTILCTQCQLKSFEFHEFIEHYNNVHLHTPSLELTLDVSDFADSTTHAETSEDEKQQSASPLRILYSMTDPSITTVTETFDTYEQPATSSDEDFTPIVLKREQPKKAAKASITKGAHVCLDCNLTYTFARNLERHMLKFHNTNNYICSNCNLAHSNYSELQAHQKAAHSSWYSCAHCERMFKSKQSQKLHELNHTTERNVLCDVPGCDKAFVSKNRLRDHKRIVHVLKPNFVCELCGYATKRSSKLTIHRRMHTGERPYHCELCDKTFASAARLSEHKPMHSTERPHVCDVCGKTFSRPKALYHHKHLHLGVKKFVCKLCGRAFAQMAGLSAHMRQHRQQDMCID